MWIFWGIFFFEKSWIKMTLKDNRRLVREPLKIIFWKFLKEGKLFQFEYLCRFSHRNVTQIVGTPSTGAIIDLLCQKLLYFLYFMQQKKHFVISDIHAEKTNLNGFPLDHFRFFHTKKTNFNWFPLLCRTVTSYLLLWIWALLKN